MFNIIFNNRNRTPVHYKKPIGKRSHKSCFRNAKLFNSRRNSITRKFLNVIYGEVCLSHNIKKRAPGSAVLAVITSSIEQYITTIVPGGESSSRSEISEIISCLIVI